MPSRPFRSSRPRLRAAASTRRSRRRASRSSTARRSSSSPTRTSRTARSPGSIPDASDLPDISTAFADAANHEGQFLPVPAGRRDACAALGDSRYARGSSTGSAAWRRRTAPATSRTTRTTTTTWFGSARARSRASLRTFPSSRSKGTRTRTCWSRGGEGPTARSRPRSGGSAEDGRKVAHAHFTHLNPLPRNTEDVLRRFDKVLVPEMNLGQLSRVLRAKYLMDAVGYNKVHGRPFTSASSPSRSRTTMSRTPRTATGSFSSRQGLHVRPGGPLVPGLRRLRDPRRRPGLPELGIPREHFVLVSGIGCPAASRTT